MRAIAYARFSSDLQRDASIEDQVRLCRARIDAEKWTFISAYTDRAMSGSMRLRPAYQTLIEDARAGAFDVVVAEALDRLSRDQEDIAALYKHLTFAGVKMVTLAEGEITELHVGLKGTMNALFLKDLGLKTRRGLEGRVREGKSGGGLCYGYDVVREVDAQGEAVHGSRRINETEAAIVRRIFREYASGRSPRAIAKALNAEGVAGPRASSWNASTIHGNWRRGTGVLNNELYIGRLVWNRQRFIKDPASGKRIARPNAPEAIIVQPVPELRIIDDELWAAVKGRQDVHQERVERTDGGYRLNAAHRQRYLFSGLLRCAACGGAYAITGKDKYGCANYRNRGTCTNSLVIKRQELEQRILVGLKEKLMAPALVKEFIGAYHAELNLRNATAEAAYEASRRQLGDVEKRIAAILTAIESGIFTPSTKERLLELEERKRELEAVRPAEKAPLLHPKLAELYAEKVGRLDEALNVPEDRAEAAEILRSLVDEIRLGPIDGMLQVELYGELGAILALGAEAKTKNRPGNVPRRFSLVAGRGFEPLTFRL